MNDDTIRTKQTVEIPTLAGKKVSFEQTEEGIRITYSGFRQPVVTLENLKSAVAELDHKGDR